MDKLVLRSSFLRGIVARFISKKIRKELAYDVKVVLNEFDAETRDGEVAIKLDGEVLMKEAEFRRLISRFEKES